ncbi:MULTISPECIES: YggS family pyridoxal phosphate-dependent enzyme [Jeotgalicoccus]|uniref:YggS family pyridoxal phosphate-dependent enzyme n=1 Tax=Jeotgalicoccus TaxID=227979 RepID=UPI0004025D00|nr:MULTISPECIES: YggS family pyridoxal phosphate-dependent enzyme [Jeotgalicoccus]
MIKENYEQIKNEVGDDVNIIAVTKYHTVEETLEAYEAGVRHFGENRIEGFIEKRKALPEDAEVHFIGTMQSRKVKEVIDDLHYLHSLERESVAKKIEQTGQHVVNCFIQVNVSDEDSKHGLQPEEVEDFLLKLKDYKYVKVIGLMTMAPHTEDSSVIENTFTGLKNLQEKVEKNYPDVTELSMGMSNDYPSAVKNGATYIRIGSKIMGS